MKTVICESFRHFMDTLRFYEYSNYRLFSVNRDNGNYILEYEKEDTEK